MAAHSTVKSGWSQETRMAGHREKSNDSVERNLALSRGGLGVSEPDSRCPQSRDCAPTASGTCPSQATGAS